MKVKIQTITPETAKAWLKEKNVNNRNVRQSLVDYYANEMIAGRWKDNDQAISFFEDGTLANGQHRAIPTQPRATSRQWRASPASVTTDPPRHLWSPKLYAPRR